MMHKFLIPLAAAASALAVATPASAQWFPQQQQQYGYNYGYAVPQAYGYGVPQGQGYGYSYGAPQGYAYGNAYGHQNNYGAVRNLQVRINALQRQINWLRSRNALSNPQARRLHNQSRALEHRLVHASRFGLGPREHANLQIGIQRLERRIAIDARNGNRYRRGDRNWQRAHQRWHNRNGRH
jgi:hypothetical protein